MPEAVAVSVAKAVHQHISDSDVTLSQKFDLARNYGEWDFDLKDDQRLRVDVTIAPLAQKAEAFTRTGLNYIVPVVICIRKKIGTDQRNDDTGEIEISVLDELMLFVEEVHELFGLTRLANFTAGTWRGTEILAAPVTEHLSDMHQFTAGILVTFAAAKKII